MSGALFNDRDNDCAICGDRGACYPTQVPALPHIVSFNLTDLCDLACAHCALDASPKGRHQLDAATFARIAAEITTLCPGPLFVLSGGEPLLRDDLEQMVTSASELGATVVIGTNGTQLGAPRIHSLRSAGVQGFALSVDSLNPVLHDAFRGREGAHHRTLAALDRLREQGADFLIQTTLSAQNIDELDALVDWSAALGALAFNLYLHVPIGRGETLQPLPTRQVDAVLATLPALRARHHGRMRVQAKCQPHHVRFDSPPFEGTRCPAAHSYCRVTPRGTLTPCPYLDLEAGDLHHSSFGQLWHGPLFRRLREGALGGRCGRCDLRQACGGCRARAHYNSADVLAEDPDCDYVSGSELPSPHSAYGDATAPSLRWTEGAETRIARVPSFVRARVVRRVEAWAKEHAISEVSEQVLDRLRAELPPGLRARMVTTNSP